MSTSFGDGGLAIPRGRPKAGRMRGFTIAVTVVVVVGCESGAGGKGTGEAPGAPGGSVAAAPGPRVAKDEGPAARTGLLGDVKTASVGSPAPDFSLANLDGVRVRLSDFAGERVVLEWFNPECPYVNLAHTKGSLKGLAAKHAKGGVAWLAVNSGGPGRQGHGAEKSRDGKSRFDLDHPVLLDPTGEVGRAYGAERTPQIYVVDERGVLVYAGAIDNSPDAEGQSPQGGELVNYVDEALTDLAAGRPVRTPTSEPYGCSVKYAK